MENEKIIKVLAIGIHVDDCESGVGGITKLLCDKKCDVTFLNLSGNNLATNLEESNKQSVDAAKILGANRIIFNYNETKYYKTNEKTVRLTEKVIKDVNPDIIFIIYPKDNHIEHMEVAQTAREAIFAAGVEGVSPNEIYAYELGPMQTMCYFNPDIYICIDSVWDDVKKSILSFNQSHASGDNVCKEKDVSAKFRGHMANCGYERAEALKIVKYPYKNNDFILRNILNGEFKWAGSKMYFANGDMFF